MFPMVDCQSQVRINGDVIGTSVSVGIDPDGGYLYLKAGSRRNLFVAPFTAGMITKWDSARMKVGVHYQISGTQVGSWSWGPLGHPGDGEFEARSLKALEIRISYSPASVVLAILGSTESGRALFQGRLDPSNPKHLTPWDFDVEFTLQKSELKRFLSIPDAFYASFEERLEQSA